jgi:hypothetical protein
MILINAVQIGFPVGLNPGYQKVFMAPFSRFPQHSLDIDAAAGGIRTLAEEMEDSKFFRFSHL